MKQRVLCSCFTTTYRAIVGFATEEESNILRKKQLILSILGKSLICGYKVQLSYHVQLYHKSYLSQYNISILLRSVYFAAVRDAQKPSSFLK